MNILINSYCNLQCPYCFAKDAMNELHSCKDMSYEDFKTAIKYCKIFGIQQLRLIGGEPSLSNNFIPFIDLGVKDPFFNEIIIFSNLTFSKEICDKIVELSQLKQISILPNINEFQLVGKTNKKKILYNLENLINCGVITTLGINIYTPQMDLTNWFDLILHYKLKNFRYSIATPTNIAQSDNFNFYEYYHSFQDKIVELAEFACKNHVKVSTDCANVPICCFNDKTITKVVTYTGCDMLGNKQCSFPVIDIDPDLTVRGCFGSNFGSQAKLTDFDTFEDLRNYIVAANSEQLQNNIARKECLECLRYKETGVSCGCLSSHKIDKRTLLKGGK